MDAQPSSCPPAAAYPSAHCTKLAPAAAGWLPRLPIPSSIETRYAPPVAAKTSARCASTAAADGAPRPSTPPKRASWPRSTAFSRSRQAIWAYCAELWAVMKASTAEEAGSSSCRKARVMGGPAVVCKLAQGSNVGVCQEHGSCLRQTCSCSGHKMDAQQERQIQGDCNIHFCCARQGDLCKVLRCDVCSSAAFLWMHQQASSTPHKQLLSNLQAGLLRAPGTCCSTGTGAAATAMLLIASASSRFASLAMYNRRLAHSCCSARARSTLRLCSAASGMPVDDRLVGGG